MTTTRRLARRLNRPPAATRTAPTGPWTVGTVTAVTLSTATITVQIQGDTTSIPGINYLDSYTPVVGDVVILHRHGTHLWALGTIAAYTGGSGSGWNLPTYFSGVTAGTQAAQYRIVADNGNLKVQLKGSVSSTVGTGNLWVMPAAATPTVSRLIPLVGAGGAFDYVSIQVGTGNVAVQASGHGTVTFDGVEYFLN